MNYYQFPQFTQPSYFPVFQNQQLAEEQSYIENILRLNLGKNVSVYMNFENSQWGSKIFKGRLEAAEADIDKNGVVDMIDYAAILRLLNQSETYESICQ